MARGATTKGGLPAQERELRAQGKRTMRKLLDAGMKVFDRRGYHAARVDDIVRLARTSHGTFYLYFANKEDLLRALIEDVAEQMVALAEALPPIAPGPEGAAALREWLAELVDAYERFGPAVRAWIEAEHRGNRFARYGAEVLGKFSARLAERIAEAHPDDDIDPNIAAVALVAMIERFLYIRSAMGRLLPFDRENVLDTLTRIVHAGVFGGSGGRSTRR